MVTKTIINFEDLLLESDVLELIHHLQQVMAHLEHSIPNEILKTPSGEPNVRTRWGAVYFHAAMAKASLTAFL